MFFIYRYIEYCRATCKPRLSEKAAEMLQNKYVEIRQVCNVHFHTTNWLFRILFLSIPDAIPITHSSPIFLEYSSSYVSTLFILQKMRQQAHETGRAAAIPITVRQLEAIIRLSESLAKMRL